MNFSRLHCHYHCKTVLLILTVGAVTALPSHNNVVILGGSGRIGTAIATHLIRRSSALPSSTGKIILVGRNPEQGQQSVQEVRDAASEFSSDGNSFEVEFQSISDVWDSKQLSPLFHDAVIISEFILVTSA